MGVSIKLKKVDDLHCQSGHGSTLLESSTFINHSDDDLWELFKSGNEDAFISIYNAHFQSLINYGYHFCNKINIVEDAVQDLFIDLRRRRGKLPRIRSSIKIFLFVALKNRLINEIRKHKYVLVKPADLEKHSFQVTNSHECELIDQQASQEIREKLQVAVNKLSFKQREALFYMFYEEYSYSDIRVLLNLGAVKSARNLVYKALMEVKKHFSKLTVQSDND